MNFTIAIIIVLVIVVVLFIALMAKNMSIWGPRGLTYYQKCSRDSFNQIAGDSWADKNQETIDYMTSVGDESKDAYDYFVEGATYMYGRQNPDKIAKNYTKALNEIRSGNVYDTDRDFVLGRIRDHVFFHPEPFAEKELEQLRNPIMNIYDDILNNDLAEAIRLSTTSPPTPTSTSTPQPKNEKKQRDEKKHQVDKKIETVIAAKVVKKAPRVQSDSQNVHDSAITLEFTKQYKKLRIYNDNDAAGRLPVVLNDALPVDRATIKQSLGTIDLQREQKLNATAQTEFLRWMKKTITDPEQYDALNRRFVNDYNMYDRMENGELDTSGTSIVKERDLISHVWRRINSTANNDHTDQLTAALALRLAACFEAGSPVCVTGRADQILSSLATLDADSGLGVLMTSAMIKGKMFSEGAKIIDEGIRALPTQIKDAYNNSNAVATLNDEDMATLRVAITGIYDSLDKNLIKYSNKLPHADALIVIESIKKEVTVD